MNRSSENIPVISVVVPVYHEENNISMVLNNIFLSIKPLDVSFEIIMVDDGSEDTTWSVISEESLKYPMLKAVRLSRNFGKESALCAGIELANGNAVITIDGDLQHPPELIPEMFRLWHEGKAEVVEAVKEDRGTESLASKWRARIFYSLLNRLTGYALNDASDFKLMDRKVVNVWLKMGERNLFYRGMSAWLGFKRIKIPFSVTDRLEGASGWSVLRLFKLAVTAVTSFSSLPLHIVTLSGGIFFVFAVILGIQTLFRKLAGDAVSGFTTVILLQLIIGSLLMMSMGIIGEYIAKIFEEVKARPRYVIAEKLENSPGSDPE